MLQGEPNEIGNKMYIALGGNAPSGVGSPRETVLAVVDILASRFANFKVSKLYQTPSFPAESGPDFVNAACTFYAEMSAADVLLELHKIELDFGRTRELRWGQRTVDLDLIACANQVLPDVATQTRWRDLPMEAQKTTAPDRLILPHPRVQDRAFVLVPMVDIAPDWVHPVLGQTTVEMLAQLPASERDEIRTL